MTQTWYSGGWGFSSLPRFRAGEISTNRQQEKIGSVQIMGSRTLAIFLHFWRSMQIKHRICTSSLSKRLLFLRIGRPQASLQRVHFRPKVWMAPMQEPSGRAHAWALDPKKPSSRQETSKVTFSFDPDWSDWPNLKEMSLVAASIWPKCSFCAN